MVSEQRRGSYVAAVAGGGESSQGAQTASPINRSPARSSSTTVSQRNLHAQNQRNYNTEKLEYPLFLSSNDNPSAVLVTPPLSGSSNYSSWSNSMQIALEIKNKWGFINGNISTPDLPKGVWEDLERRFSQQDAQRSSVLQNDINNLKQGSLPVNEYYTRARTLWEEMNALRLIPICRCEPRCSCELTDQIRKERDTDQVIRFLQGLNEEYNSLKSNVLVLEPLPEVYKVFVMAEKQERQNSLTNMNLGSLDFSHANAVNIQGNQIINADEAVSIAAVNTYNGRHNYNNKGARCTHCGMTGHTVDKCYKKHGYPPGWVSGYKSKGKKQLTAGTNVNDLGISEEQLRKIISVLQPQSGQTSSSAHNTTDAVSLASNFSPINEGKCSISHVNSIAMCSNTWILDSGATNHIACSLKFFDDYREARDIEVNLPNGECIPVKHVGNIRLNSGIWLKEVLHIPLFKFNIVSVSRLLQEESHRLIFMSDQCMIQKTHGLTTGLAKHEQGLYMLLEPPKKRAKSYAVPCITSEI
ncbi:uncharacterized protein LOC116001300 [Ipomoea triloba]|uniref:uncharacterized protein LOC116001299 n=1 Tax=Ipomoea triloba TaxID=35885 RepID=UPI00125DFEB1|nr:uncharacterized protein LOC116001299 [Ipomoea triloba]XP_031097044.1 uncharacterized protein LOC116001300 [Ipomoea triloba]